MTNLVKIIITAEDKASGVFKGMAGVLSGVGAGVIAAGAAIGTGIVAIGTAAFGASQDTAAATGDMRAQFGMTAEDAERTAQLARDAWASNWGDSIGEVAGAMGVVQQQLGELGVTSDEEITRVATNALALRDTFGTEVPESIDATRALMERFGLSSEEAFNLVTAGMQSGLSANGDFLESITEYAPVFEAAGFSADQMYSIMESGAASGVLGTDKIADAVKEMGVILNEGGERAETAFESIGLNFNEIAGFVAAGDETWADYFDDIVAGINGIEDPMERQKAQVAIFGTMAEDLGANFTEGLTTAGAAMSDFEGSADSLDRRFGSLGGVFEGMQRQIITAFTPVTDYVLAFANEHMPKIQEAVGVVAGVFSSFFSNLEEGMSPLDAFIEAIWDIAPPELLAALVDFRDNVLPGLIARFTEIKDAVIAFVSPIAQAITEFVSWKDVLLGLAAGVAAVVIPAIISIVTAMAPVLLVVAAVIAIVALLRNAWESNFGGIQEKTAAVISFVRNIIETGLAAIKSFWDAHGAAILATAQKFWGLIRDFIKGIIDTIKGIFSAFRSLFEGDWEAFGRKIVEVWKTAWETTVKFLSGLWEMIRPVLTSVWNSIRDWFTNTDWRGLGERIINGIVAGISALGHLIADTLMGLAQQAWSAVTDWITGGGKSAAGGKSGRGVGSAFAIGDFGTGASVVMGSRSAVVRGGGGSSMVINIDARGAARGVERDVRRVVEDVMREYGVRADARIRTGG